MLTKLNQIKGCSLSATDGDIGSARDVYFDYEYWVVRYLVVRTSGWLNGKQVLITPRVLGEVDVDEGEIPISLSLDQIKMAPDAESDRPISRREEALHYQYYGWPTYWADFGAGTSTVPGMATQFALDSAEAIPVAGQGTQHHNLDSSLRSAEDVIGYHLSAQNGEIGHVDEFLIDSIDWRVRYLLVDTKNWWIGKKVVIPVSLFRRVDWLQRSVSVDLTQDQIQEIPQLPSGGVSPEFEDLLAHHFQLVSERRSQ